MDPRTLVATLAALLVPSLVAVAQIPEMIPFQGYLESAGVALTDTVDLTFKLYDQGDVNVWTEVQGDVAVIGGIFSVQLGSSVPFGALPFDQPYELGVSVNADAEMVPRTAFGASPFALGLRNVRVTPKSLNRAPDIIAGSYGNDAVTVGGGVTIGGGGTTSGSTFFGSCAAHPGGNVNFAGNSFATIGGGYKNYACNSATVGGGRANDASGIASTVAGGESNDASGSRSTISGGAQNEASGSYSTVPGGILNVASGYGSFAAGYKAEALHRGTFVWADSTTGNTFQSTADYQFLVRAGGGVGLGTDSPDNQLTVAGDADVTGKLGVGESNPRGMITVRGPDSAPDGPMLYMFGNSPDQVESGRIRFVEGTNSANLRGAYIRYDGNGNRLHIGTHDASDALISSDDDAITIKRSNQFVGLGVDPTERLHVNGNALADAHTLTSDARLKQDVRSIEKPLALLTQLRGVRFDWREEAAEFSGHSGADIGVIAQEVMQAVPEAVFETGSGYLSVDYGKLVPVLIEATKQQQNIIDQQQALIQQQAEALNRQEERVAALERAVGS